MIALLLSLLLWSQGIPAAPSQSGAVTGVLRDSQGRPVSGVRVMAIPRPDSAEDLTSGTAMSSIAETDAQGRFRLESVPPGRYYIAAGRLDLPTYYPGTQAMGEGRVVVVAAADTVSGIDFALRESSAGRADPNVNAVGLVVPLVVRVDGGGSVPVFGDGLFTMLRLVPVQGGSVVAATLNQTLVSPPAATVDYRATIEGLPPGYSVRSIRYGNTELRGGTLSFAGTTFSTGGLSLAPPQTLTILLSRAPTPRSPGVRVSGRLKTPDLRALYLSGVPGALYADGSFEFFGVPPGRHALAAFESRLFAPALAASFIVGDRDVDGVEFEETPVIPYDPKTPSAPPPASGRPPGALPLAVVRGRVLDGETAEPLRLGSVFLVGYSWAEVSLAPEGRFAFPRLLPGRYEIEVQGVGYPKFRQTVEVEDGDIEIELKTR